jgi:DNA-binding response OmpR family regulator
MAESDTKQSLGSKRILVIEDDRDIARLVELHLRDLGYGIKLARDGIAGLQCALSTPYDLIILDLMLPGMDGVELCQRLRTKPNYTPILMLTAKSTEFDRVLGLEVGADDYLTKPFSVRELQARVKALFRRVEALTAQVVLGTQQILHAGDLRIDLDRRGVTLQGKLLDLTTKEFDLLREFARHPGRVYTRAQLLDLVWGYGHAGYEHTVNSHINRLRAKIEKDPAHPRYILTVWGVGYKFFDSEDPRKG